VPQSGSTGCLVLDQSLELNPAVKDAAPGTSLQIVSPAAAGSLSASAVGSGAGVLVGCQAKGLWAHGNLPRAAAVARRREPSFLPAEELSAPFQTSRILSNLWVSMKSLQFDTRSAQSGSQSCAIPSSLFWNLACIFFYFIGTSVSQMCPFHRGNSGPRAALRCCVYLRFLCRVRVLDGAVSL